MFKRAGTTTKSLILLALLILYIMAGDTDSKIDDSVTLGLLVLFGLWTGYGIFTEILKKYFKKNAFTQDDTQRFLVLWRYGWMGIGLIFAIISFSGSIRTLGLSAAFLGMVFGWSLQAPVTGIAAWIMIMVKRPFTIGDRIIISGITGDVMDINMTHIVLNQVGGTVSGEERSGRGVLIPNATLFNQTIHNFNYESKYILDEVVVLISFRSNFDEAKQILLDAAKQVTADIIQDTGKDPYIRVEISAEHGIRIRLRFQNLSTDRQRISSDITDKIIRGISGRYDHIEFAFPHTEIIYRNLAAEKSAKNEGNSGLA